MTKGFKLKTTGFLKLGPLRCRFRESEIIVRLLSLQPRNITWPKRYQRDVAEALAKIIEDYPGHKVRLKDWMPTCIECPHVVKKMSAYKVEFDEYGGYFLGRKLARVS